MTEWLGGVEYESSVGTIHYDIEDMGKLVSLDISNPVTLIPLTAFEMDGLQQAASNVVGISISITKH